MRAHELLLGLGDPAAMRLPGVLQGGVVDLRAARPDGPDAGRAPAVAGAGAAAVLGDQRVLDCVVHDARTGQQIEVLDGNGDPLPLAGARADPLHGDEPGGAALELLQLFRQRLERDRQVGVFRVLVDDETAKRGLVRLLARDVRDVDGLHCHQGGFLLDQMGFTHGLTLNEKHGKKQRGWSVSMPRSYREERDLVSDSARQRPSGPSRWRTAAVLTVVAGFFVLTLVSRWHQVTAVKWSLHPGYFTAACAVLVASYALVATLWASALARVAPVGVAAGVRIWFVANLARYVPGNVWSFVGAVELARREGAPRRTTLAVMAQTQVLSVGVALLVGLPVLIAERDRLGRPVAVGLAVLVVLLVAVVVLWRPLERLARRRYPDLGPVLDRVLRRGGPAGPAAGPETVSDRTAEVEAPDDPAAV